MHDTLTHVVHIELGDSVPFAIVTQGLYLDSRDLIFYRSRPVRGRHVVVRNGQHAALVVHTPGRRAVGDDLDRNAHPRQPHAAGAQDIVAAHHLLQRALQAGNVQVTFEEDRTPGGDTIVQLDVDGDAGADLTIRLSGEVDLTATDFRGAFEPAAPESGELSAVYALPAEDLMAAGLFA